jgi:cation-transporting P-type ATPase C
VNSSAPTALASPQLQPRSVLPGRIRWDVPGLRERAHRAASVGERLAHIHGVSDVAANPVTGRVLVVFDPAVVTALRVEELVADAVLRPVESNGLATTEKQHTHDHAGEGGLGGYVFRLVAGGLALGAMLVHKLFWLPIGFPPGFTFAITATITIVAGYPFFRGGIRSLSRLPAADTDTLITVATIASILLRESVTALIVLWLLNLGDLLQAIVLRRTRRAIRELLSVGDREAWVILSEGTAVRIPLDEVHPGDLVAVYTGEKVPVDGPVEAGQGTLNEAPITGESMPVFRNPGDCVYAGTLVEAGWLHVRAEQVGDATAVGRLIQRVEEARELKAPIERIGDTFSRRFVPASFLLAGLVFALTRDVRRSVTMLVVACPCAAGLATPTAISATIGNAARRGVLIKGGTSLEAAGKLDTVVFDKTGTLTAGRPRVARVIASGTDSPVEELLSLAASGELHSPHPLGLAVVRHTREHELEIPEHEECELLVGRGMRADMQGNRILVGSRRLLDEFGLSVPSGTDEKVQDLRDNGETVLYVAVNDRYIGLIGVSDLVRPEARSALDTLRRTGVRTIMLTGDAAETAEPVARQLGISEFHASLLPEAKLDLVRKLQADGHRVAMVGDGINDAPSLAAADLGIAIGTGGTDIAIEAADMALASSDIREVAHVIEQSRATMRVVRQNYGLALGVNGTGIVIGALGALNPVIAAVLHNLSTLAVVANSSRLIGFQPGRAPGRRPMIADQYGNQATEP